MLHLLCKLEAKEYILYATTNVANTFFAVPLAAEIRPQFAFALNGVQTQPYHPPWHHLPNLKSTDLQIIFPLNWWCVIGRTTPEVLSKGCGRLTLGYSQVPTQPLTYSTSSPGQGEKIGWKAHGWRWKPGDHLPVTVMSKTCLTWRELI